MESAHDTFDQCFAGASFGLLIALAVTAAILEILQ
jgi:ribosomal protein S12 methylthiotransferase accessory factor YcaO